jgi:acyl-CoA synthetase (AMP-forming)/AMP-acid ligase II
MAVRETLMAEGPPLADIPEVTIPHLVRERARQHPERPALVDASSGHGYTYGELDYSIGRCAAGLSALGLKPGDTLLIFMPNSPEWAIAALGAMAAGLVVSGANPMYNADDLAYQLRDAGARVVLTIPRLLATVREAAAAAGCETVIVVGEADGGVSFASLLACSAAEPLVAADLDALAALPYSSGTTGLPKAVMLTHRNIVANIRQIAQAHDPPPDAVMLAYLPMFHIYGLSVLLLYGLAMGAHLVTLPRFEPEIFLQALQRYRVTHLNVVPPILQFLALHPLVESYDLSALQSVTCGAAPLGSPMERRAAERLKCVVAQGFGMTESSGVVAVSYPAKSRVGASGQMLPGTQARVVDPESGADLERGATGELWFRGPQGFQGYLNRPAETAATITPDGWIRTGDIGHIDADGYLYITDRLKELIKVKGFQVPPAELESLLVTHPLGTDAAVIGRPDERKGETPVAYVVARGALDSEVLKAWVAERVVDYKQLGDVVLCDSIPKTASGKILRRVLRALDAERAQRARVAQGV